jgi:CRISPR/Cas system-associated exonuclease Cas4 (RecB family)
MLPRSTVYPRLQMEVTLALGKLQYKGVLATAGVLAIEDALTCPVTAGASMGLFLGL